MTLKSVKWTAANAEQAEARFTRRFEHPRLKFQGNTYILVNYHGTRIEGSIATQEQYDNFEESFAYLMSDGRIMRYCKIIGSAADIEWLD